MKLVVIVLFRTKYWRNSNREEVELRLGELTLSRLVGTVMKVVGA